MNGERIAFENWLGIKPCGAAHDLAWAAWQARASLPAPQQATPEPVNVWTRALEIRMAQGWRLTGDRLPVLYTDSINGDQVMRDDLWLCTTEALRSETAAATPEPAAWVLGDPAMTDSSNVFLAHEFTPDTEHIDEWSPLYTHPAPGVPEGFALVPVEPTDEMVMAGALAHQRSPCHDFIGPIGDAWVAMLAAAQAKGGEHEGI